MTTNRPWDRPWSMDEMIENSDNWNLAGDVALLNTLKSFADNLLTKSTETNNNLENLTKKLDETSLQLNISQNQFQGLRNTQFIESRVYEDDESLPTQKNIENSEEKIETSLSEEVRLGALKGLEVLNKYFEKVEVEVSDSEDDDIDLPFVLRPKDLYIDRPLPYVIGSEEWHKNWHVGLEDSSSDSETEKVSDNLSESESESQIIQDRSQIKETSETSSELDFSKIDNKVNFNSSDSENSVAAHNSGRNFAEELSKKLGKVITENYEEPEVNKRPIQPVKSNYGDIFFDEPPPLDEPKGLFSGGGGLFDDEVEESEANRIIEEPPKPSKGIFFEEENVFAKEEPPEDTEEKKKPVGGVSIFGGGNLFDKKLLRRQRNSSSEEEEEEVKEETKKVDLFGDDDLFTKNEKSVKKMSLFDSDNDEDVKKKKIFSEDKVTKVKKINLFDSDDEKEDEKDGLFVEVKNKDEDVKKKIFNEDGETKVKKTNLFDSDEEKDLFDKNEKEETNNSFSSTVKNEENKAKKEEKKISLFDDDDDLFKDDLFSTNSKKKFTSGLFDDLPEDDLFATKFEEKSKPSANLFEDVLTIADDKNSINGDGKKDAYKKSEESGIFTSSVEAKTHTQDIFNVSSEENKKDSEDIFASSISVKTNEDKNEDICTVTSEEVKKNSKEDIFTTSEESKKDNENISTISSEENKKESKEDIFVSSISEETKKDRKDICTVSSEQVKKNSNEYNFTTSEEIKKDNEDIFNLSFDAPKPKSRLNLFDSSPENEDIFSSKKPKVAPREKSSPIPNVPIFDSNPPPDDDDWDTKSENLSENEDLGNDFEEISSGKASLFSEEPPSLENKFKPGKLKHNLNINVGALMPGAAPPRRDVRVSRTDVIDDKLPFDETDSVEVLHSVTKDRAKRPLNRRPSTRRGRKAALKSSDSDFKLGDDNNVTEESVPKKVETDDLFTQKVSKPDTKPSKSLFDEEDDDDLFTSKNIPTQQTKTVKKSLFDDENDDDDDDIFKSFASTSAKKVDTKMATEKKITKISAVKKLENTKPDDDPLSALLK